MLIPIEDIIQASKMLATQDDFVKRTPLDKNLFLSGKHHAQVFLKREDLQVIRSYKIRGALNKILNLTEEEKSNGIVCSSAGNHAQGVAYACNLCGIKGKIFMPVTSPKQKVNKVRQFGKEFVDLELVGDTYDESFDAATQYSKSKGKTFVHAFDDMAIIVGQATVGKEIVEQASVGNYGEIDYIFVPVGGGGLSAGVGSYIRHKSPKTKIIGVEPSGAASMKLALDSGKNTRLASIDPFVDGAAVAKVGDLPFEIGKEVLDDVITVPEGRVCTTILNLYNEDAIVLEPAGALSIAALGLYGDKIKDKNVVCIVSGGNNDITRMEEIKERSMLFEGLKHYFIVNFPQRVGALKEFINILGTNADIVHFNYTKKTNRSIGPAMIGIEIKQREDFQDLVNNLTINNISFQHVNENKMLAEFIFK